MVTGWDGAVDWLGSGGEVGRPVAALCVGGGPGLEAVAYLQFPVRVCFSGAVRWLVSRLHFHFFSRSTALFYPMTVNLHFWF